MSIDLVVCAWQTAFLAAVVGVVQLGCGRWLGPGWRRLLWLPVALRALSPVLPPAPWSLWRWEGTTAPVVATVTTTAATVAYDPAPVAESSVALSAIPAAATGTSATPFPWMTVLVLAWLAGALALGLLRWRRGRLHPLATPPIALRPDLSALASSCAALLGLRRVPCLRLVDDGCSPGLGGLLRPTVYLPVGLVRAAPIDELEAVLLHEFAHRRHRDHLWSRLAGLARLLHWFDPLAWWAAARDRRDAELACDAAVASALAPERRLGYARGLLSAVARLRDAGRAPATAMSAEDLRRRLLAIRDWRRAPRWRAAVVLVLALGLAACGLTRPAGPAAGTVVLAGHAGHAVVEDGAGAPELRVYDVADLVAPVADCPAPPVDSRRAPPVPAPRRPPVSPLEVARLVLAAVDAGEPQVRVDGTTLCVTATPAAHAHLARGLEALRERHSLMVLVRCSLVRLKGEDMHLEADGLQFDDRRFVATLKPEAWAALRDAPTTAVERNVELTMFNGQRGHFAAVEQQTFIDRYDEATGDPQVECVSVGDLVEIRPVVSADQRYLSLQLKAVRSELQQWRRRQVERPVVGGQAPVMEPVILERTLHSTVCLPDGGAVLLAGFTGPGGIPDRRDQDLALLVQADVIRFEEVETDL